MCNALRGFLLPLLAALFTATSLPPATAAQKFDWNRLISATPSWPIVSVGVAIKADVIDEWRANAYRCPAKTPSIKPFPSKSKWVDGVDKGTGQKKSVQICDDGDSALFLGMLCVSGEAEACDAVRASQVRGSGTNHDGQWYRSPNRAYLGINVCPQGPGPSTEDQQFYCTECVNGFSTDMGLGVAFYLFKSDDMAAFKAWASWMERNAKTTSLKWDSGKTQKFPWPRWCDLDSVCRVNGEVVKAGKPAGPVSSGACFVTPNHAPDLEYLDAKVDPDFGRITTKALANSKHIKGVVAMTVTAVTGALVPGVVIDDAVTARGSGFSNHLEAVRVLMKTVAVNPELKFETLPPVPSSASMLAGPWDPVRNEDPAVSHRLATNIYNAQTWNPFYRFEPHRVSRRPVGLSQTGLA